VRHSLTVLNIFLALGTGLHAAATKPILENNSIRVTFDSDTGLFAIQSITGSGLDLKEIGPALQVDGALLTPQKAKSKDVTQDSFTGALGSGRKLSIRYAFEGALPDLRYEIGILNDKPWVTVTAHLPQGSYHLGDVDLIRGNTRVSQAFRSKFYVSSGMAGGNSGVWELGMRSWRSSSLAVIYDPALRQALGMGFYSFRRAATSVYSRYLTSNAIAVRAAAHYHEYQPARGALEAESLLLSFGKDPLERLEDWAAATEKTVKPVFNHDTRAGLLNPWYIYGNEITEAGELKQAQLLKSSILPSYGIEYVIAGEWQKQRSEPGDLGDSLGFGEDEEDLRLFPRGFKWICDQIRSFGLKPAYGFNYAYAAPESSVARRHPSWMITADRSRMDFGYPIDYTNPEARDWLHGLAHRAVDLESTWLWTDFNGGPTRGKLHDPAKIMGFEDVREGLRAIRTGAGPDVLRVFVCCGPYFASIGLVDRVRTGNDMAGLGDWEGLKETARQLASMYMAHQKLWITDADPIFVGGANEVRNAGTLRIPPDPSILEEARMRLQLFVTTGSFPSIGENLEDYDAERTRLLTLVLPSYGQAARPLDLFDHATPEIFDLEVKRDWDDWHVLILQNWNENPKSYSLDFARLGLDSANSYLVFRFWDQRFLGEFSGNVELRVEGRHGECFAIRKKPSHPWVMSTDMHLTQGGVELESVRFDNSSRTLSGKTRRHAGANGQIVLYAPDGYRVETASAPFREVLSSSGARSVHLKLKFDNDVVPWSVKFH